ncbi:MAG: hypothetical protein ABTQ32_04560 [Myxococcaceae bacterium]
MCAVDVRPATGRNPFPMSTPPTNEQSQVTSHEDIDFDLLDSLQT